MKSPQQPILIEELQVLKYGEPILNIKITKGSEKSPRSLLVTSNDEIMSLPLQRCHVATTCSACVALQDPYCGWDLVSSKCVSQSSFNSEYASEFLQNISVGRHRQCGDSQSSVLIEEFKVKEMKNVFVWSKMFFLGCKWRSWQNYFWLISCDTFTPTWRDFNWYWSKHPHRAPQRRYWPWLIQ